MPFYFFIWSDETIEHLAEHGVTPAEFEAIVENPEDEDVSRSSGLPIAFGPSDDGRRLACVYKLLDDATVEPVTAFEVDED